ncbi:hypothetical protein JCM11641_007060 [Rhodosporidiobolus odoratus]
MSHNQNHYRSHAPSRRDTARHPPRVHRFSGMTSGPGGHMMESLKKAFFRAMPKGEPGAEEWRTGLKNELKQNYGRWSVLDRARVNEVAKELRSWRREGKRIPEVPQVVAMFAWPVFRQRALVDKPPAVLTPLSGEVIVDLDFSPLDVSTETLYSLVDQAGCDQLGWKAEIWAWLGYRWGTMEPLSREAMIDILAEEVLYVKRWNVLAMPFQQQVPLGHPAPFAQQNVPRMPSSHVPPPPSASHPTNHRFDATTQMLPDFQQHVVPQVFPPQAQYNGMNAAMQNEMIPPAFATPTNHGGVNPSVQNQFMTSAYPLVQQPRQDPTYIESTLQDWHQIQGRQPQAAVPSSDTYGMLPPKETVIQALKARLQHIPVSNERLMGLREDLYPTIEKVQDPDIAHQYRSIGHRAAKHYGTTKARWEAAHRW